MNAFSTLLGVDTGGTFTDFIVLDAQGLRSHKRLSTPEAPERAILEGIAELGLSADGLLVVHGSTVATNAVLEGKGAKVAYVTNVGFADVLSIGRQNRSELYNLMPEPVPPPVPPELCFELPCRRMADGSVLEPLTEADLQALRQEIDAAGVESVAINLLFSFLDDAEERQVAEALPDALFLSRSSAVLPEIREYERGITTWLNAYVGPKMRGYLSRLQAGLDDAGLTIMQSSGGTIDASQAASRSVNLLLSGPAGGLAAAKFLGEKIAEPRLLTFDMGGTSTDVAFIDSDIRLTSEGRIGRYPVAVPMVDMHTIGAGGGSIASVDAGGLLQVGPESAGASPGPACYGQGGQRATVTDANLVLGRLPGSVTLGGSLALDITAAETALDYLAASLNVSREEAALGVIEIANEHMAQALRVISVQRGEDPRDAALMSFGGAGGLHACELAERLEMRRVFVPANAGVLSALGMLAAPRQRVLTRSKIELLADVVAADIERGLAELQAEAQQGLKEEGVQLDEMRSEFSIKLRYAGQSHALEIPWTSLETCSADFEQLHEQRYGHRLKLPLELTALQVKVIAEAVSDLADGLTSATATSKPKPIGHQTVIGHAKPVPVYARSSLSVATQMPGPLCVVEDVATTWVPQGWQLRCDHAGNLLLNR